MIDHYNIWVHSYTGDSAKAALTIQRVTGRIPGAEALSIVRGERALVESIYLLDAETIMKDMEEHGVHCEWEPDDGPYDTYWDAP